MSQREIFPIKVYYADTDCGGLVYYATYMRWMEMGRCEFFNRMGVDLRQQQEEGLITVVARANLSYHKPGRYADLIHLVMWVGNISPVSFKFFYQFIRPEGDKNTLLVEAETQMVCVETGSFRLLAIPKTSLGLLYARAQETP